MGVCIIFKQQVTMSCHSFKFDPMVDSNAFEDGWKKKKKYRRNPLASPSKELTNLFIYFFYIWSDKLPLSLLPLPHSCIPSGSPRSRFFCRFQLQLPRTFSFFYASTNFFAYSFSLFGPIRRLEVGFGSTFFARQMKGPEESQNSNLAM